MQDGVKEYRKREMETVLPVGGRVLFCDGMEVHLDTHDATVWKEVVVEDCYRVSELVVGQGRVIDVGAHRGYFAFAVRQAHRDAKVVCVEMDRENAEVLARNARVVGDVAVVDEAVWYGASEVWRWTTDLEVRKAGAARCHVSPREEGDGSVVWAPERGVFSRRAGKVGAVTVEQVADHYGWETYDVLKLDCEGAELNVLPAMDATRCWQIVGEWHGNAAFARMMEGLMAPGQKFHGWTLERWGERGELGTFRLTR